ncbi:hypothetical protein [Moraxella bovoculi]|uniref:hypothetical protein n=1 Tax=Moraxella bovoculi TaxID=386891 RepID=UPI0012D37EFF|nr:hypothetical protein [Moraxella bovoculi]
MEYRAEVRLAGTQVRRYAGTQVRRYAGTQVRRYAGTHYSALENFVNKTHKKTE